MRRICANGIRWLAPRIAAHPVWWTLGALLVVALILPVAVPVYFREDDVHYLNWARTHAWRDCWRPSEAVLFGMFRPVQNVVWWSLYRLAGLNPYPYHVVVLFSYLAALAAFFAFIREACSLRVAVAAVVAYGLAFHFLTYIIFWFSDLTYTLELAFAHWSLWLFALAVRRNTRRHLAAAAVVFVAAVAAKEPAALIVPLVCGQLLAVTWGQLDRRTRLRCGSVAGLMLVAGITWLLLNPSLQTRQGLPLWAAPEVVWAFVRQRWSFYAGSLTTFPAILVLAAALLPLLQMASGVAARNAARAPGLLGALAVVAAFLLKTVPDIALLVLMLTFPVLILARHPAGIGAMWAAPALLGIMTLDYVVRTYLVEAAFGLALLCGTSAVPLMDRHLPRLATHSGGARRRYLAVAAVAVLAMGLAIGPRLAEKWRALNMLSANRQNFAAAVAFLADPGARIPAPLLILDYADMGLVYERDILPLPDGEKALRQKTMNSITLGAFLPDSGLPVRNLGWWHAHPEVGEASLLTMNTREEDVLGGIAVRKVVLREWAQGGTRVRLYHITRTDAPVIPSGSTGTGGR